jgi:hypothetical protein
LLQTIVKLVPTLLGAGKVTLQVADANNNTYSLSKLTALGNTVIELTPVGKEKWVLQSSHGNAYTGLSFKSTDTNPYDFTKYPRVEDSDISQPYANETFCKEIHEGLAALFPAA